MSTKIMCVSSDGMRMWLAVVSLPATKTAQPGAQIASNDKRMCMCIMGAWEGAPHDTAGRHTSHTTAKHRSTAQHQHTAIDTHGNITRLAAPGLPS
jgi:hypothetical protein